MSRKPSLSTEEQYQLIMECRKSGMSDHHWCLENGIRPGNFYNWVARLKKKGYEIPKVTKAERYAPTPKQDVVKLEILDDSLFEQTTADSTFKNQLVQETSL